MAAKARKFKAGESQLLCKLPCFAAMITAAFYPLNYAG